MKTVPSSSSLSLISQTCPGSSAGASCFYTASYTGTATSSPYRTIVAKSKKQHESSKVFFFAQISCDSLPFNSVFGYMNGYLTLPPSITGYCLYNDFCLCDYFRGYCVR